MSSSKTSEAVMSVYLTSEDRGLWEDAEKVFGAQDSISRSRLSSSLGSISFVRRLANLGLVTVDGDTVTKTNIEVEAPQRGPIVLIVDDYDDDDEDEPGKKKRNKGSIKLEKSMAEVQAAIELLSTEDRGVLNAALSSVDWNSTDHYRIALRVALERMQLAGLPSTKADLVRVLQKIGFYYEIHHSDFWLPSFLREYRP